MTGTRRVWQTIGCRDASQASRGGVEKTGGGEGRIASARSSRNGAQADVRACEGKANGDVREDGWRESEVASGRERRRS